MAEGKLVKASSAIVRDCHGIRNHISRARNMVGSGGNVCIHFCATKVDSRKSKREVRKLSAKTRMSELMIRSRSAEENNVLGSPRTSRIVAQGA